MTDHPRVHRRYDAWGQPTPYVVEFHDPSCQCVGCQAFEPAVKPVEPALTFYEAGWIAAAAIVVGSAIAFTINPHGAWMALVEAFGGVR